MIICINDRFSPEARELYEKYGVVTPYLDATYEIREVVITRVGVGLLLEELVNPKISIGEEENGFMVEVSWNIRRFRTLDNKEVDISNWKKEEPNSIHVDLV